MPLLGLIWGLLSRGWHWLLAAVGSATGLVVASTAARAAAVTAAIVAFVLWIPVPGWVDQIPALIAAVPAEVVYVARYARVGDGLTIVLSAYAIRFAARLVLAGIRG